MAKMKIYEIARSIQQQDKNIKSGDLVTLLNENGFEVKGANSNIEDEAIGFLMNYFKKKKAAAKAEPKEEVKTPVKEEPKVEKKEEPKVEKKVEEKKEEPKVEKKPEEKKPEEKKPEEKKPEEKKPVEKKPEEKKVSSQKPQQPKKNDNYRKPNNNGQGRNDRNDRNDRDRRNGNGNGSRPDNRGNNGNNNGRRNDRNDRDRRANIHAETTAATETVMEITTTACLSVLRRRRADLTELNRSRKTPVREIVRKMIEIINQVVTARVRRKK